MIRKPISFPNRSPLTRRSAALLVRDASRFESRLMIEHNAKIVNAKSMLGLLAEGPDEAAAADAMEALLKSDQLVGA